MKHAAGFTLIEVMITVFVVAIGLLGVAGMQVMSKKSTFDAQQHTLASALAQDIIERMRANAAQADAYLTSGIGDSNPPASASCNATGSSAPSATACTPADTAKSDLYQWYRALVGAGETVHVAGVNADENAGGLSAATGCITKLSCGTYAIAVAWRGVTSLPEDSSLNSCGSSNPSYSDPAISTPNARLRRVLVINAYIANPTTAGACP